jgi:hypothetical protein
MSGRVPQGSVESGDGTERGKHRAYALTWLLFPSGPR